MKKYFMFLGHKWESLFEPVEITNMTDSEVEQHIIDCYIETFINSDEWDDVEDEDITVERRGGTVTSPYYDTVDFTIFSI